MPLFESVRACDLYDIRLVCLKGTTLYHSDCFLEIKQMRNMEGKRWDRKSEIASFRKKKNIRVTHPVILKDTLKLKTKFFSG